MARRCKRDGKATSRGGSGGALVTDARPTRGAKHRWPRSFFIAMIGILTNAAGCAQLAVWDADGNRLDGIPVVVGADDAQHVVYVNIQSSPLGNATISIETDENGRLRKLQTTEDTSRLSPMDLTRFLPILAVLIGVREAAD